MNSPQLSKFNTGKEQRLVCQTSLFAKTSLLFLGSVLVTFFQLSSAFSSDCDVPLRRLITSTGFKRKVQNDEALKALQTTQIRSSLSLDVAKSLVVEETLQWAKNELAQRYRKDGNLDKALILVRQKSEERFRAAGIEGDLASSLSKEMAELLSQSVDPRFPLLPETVDIPDHQNFFREQIKRVLEQVRARTIPQGLEILNHRRNLVELIPEGEQKQIQLNTINGQIRRLQEFQRADQVRESAVYNQVADARERGFPYGMKDSIEFQSFGRTLREKLGPMLSKLKSPAPQIYLMGSSVTGLSFEPKVRELDLKRPFNAQSDYDVVVVIPDAHFTQLVRKGVISSDPSGAQGLRSIPYSKSRSPETLAQLLNLQPSDGDTLSTLKAFTHQGKPLEVPVEKVSVSVYGESYFNKRNTPDTKDFSPMMKIP